MMSSYYVIVTIKLCPEVGNDEYIIVCNFGARGMSGFEVIEVCSEAHRGRKNQKKPALNRVHNIFERKHISLLRLSLRSKDSSSKGDNQ